MRLISTLLFLFISIYGNAQEATGGGRTCGLAKAARLRTTNDTVGQQPILIIDGVVYEFGQLKKLSPNDIVSIEILKESTNPTSCYSSRRGVIAVTTKIVSRKFIIRDAADSSVISGATMQLTSKAGVISGAANEKGIFTATSLNRETEYKMKISVAGYKTIERSLNSNSSTEQEIFLERDIQLEDEIIITCRLIRRRGCPIGHVWIEQAAAKTVEIKEEKVIVKPIYPNPVQRSQTFNLEFKNENDETLQLSVVGLDGRMVMLQQQKIFKGINRLTVTADTRWSAGIYLVWLKNEKGVVLKQDKLVVQ